MAKCSEILRLLIRKGWSIDRQKGSHIVLVHHTRTNQIVFPNHGSAEMKTGTLRALLRQAGLSDGRCGKNKRDINMAKIKVKVEKTRTGFSAYAVKYAAFTTGKSVQDLAANMVDALNLLFEAAQKEKVISQEDLSFEMALSSIFEVYTVINMKSLANRVGMNYSLLSQYATGKKKASPKQSAKIIDGIRQIGRELSELSLISGDRTK